MSGLNIASLSLAILIFSSGASLAERGPALSSPQGSSVYVGSKAVDVAPRNAKRRSIMFVNPSLSRRIYVVPANQEPTIGRGIPIQPEGFWTAPYSTDSSRPTSGWKAIADGEGEPVPLEILESF